MQPQQNDLASGEAPRKQIGGGLLLIVFGLGLGLGTVGYRLIAAQRGISDIAHTTEPNPPSEQAIFSRIADRRSPRRGAEVRPAWTNIVNNKLMPVPPNLSSLQPEINVFLVNR
jgi:hypothetical protein